MTNRSAVLYAERDLRVEDRPVPEPGPLEVVVQSKAVGLCGSDIHYFEHGRVGRYVVDAPMVLGHVTVCLSNTRQWLSQSPWAFGRPRKLGSPRVILSL
jgi:hypothetical protein